MKSSATSVSQYLRSLPPDRRRTLTVVRDVITSNLPQGIVESMNWGMIAYEVPLTTYPDTYNGRPLMYAALAAQKHHMAVYLTGIYADDRLRNDFEAAYLASGKRMDLGKSCVRFRTLDDLPLELIGAAISAMTLGDFLALHSGGTSTRASRATRRT